MNLILKLLSTLALIAIAACAVFFITNCCTQGSGPAAGARQLIAGSSHMGVNASVYGSTSNTSINESDVQMRMSPGTASKLRVHTTSNGPITGGQLTTTVRVNGANTALSCQLSAAGDCDSGTASVALADDDRLVVLISNNLSGPSSVWVHWTLLYN